MFRAGADVQGEATGAGLAQLGEGKLWGPNSHHFHRRGGCGEMATGFSQRWAVGKGRPRVGMGTERF